MYIHTYTHTYIRTYIHTYIRTYIHIHTYIHTYTHRANPHTVPPDIPPPSHFAHDSLWIGTPFHTVFWFTATLDITPQIVAKEQYLGWLCVYIYIYIYMYIYCDSLRDGRSGVWNPLEVRFSIIVQTGPEAYLASFTLALGLFSWRRAARCWRWLPYLVSRSWMVGSIPLTPQFILMQCEWLLKLTYIVTMYGLTEF